MILLSRGGKRQGTPGQSYSNRTDLLNNYASTAPAPPAPQTGAPVQPAQPPVGAPATGAPPVPPPGSLNTFGPTQRPNEPLTHGLPSGPGAGPEVLQQFTPDPLVQASALLSSIPAVHQTPAIKALAAAVGASVQNGTNTGIAQGGAQ